MIKQLAELADLSSKPNPPATALPANSSNPNAINSTNNLLANNNNLTALLNNPQTMQLLINALNTPGGQNVASSFLSMLNPTAANTPNPLAAALNPLNNLPGGLPNLNFLSNLPNLSGSTSNNPSSNGLGNITNPTNPLFGITDQFNGYSSWPGFNPSYFNPYNPWLMNYNPTLLNLLKQTQSATPLPPVPPANPNNPLISSANALPNRNILPTGSTSIHPAQGISSNVTNSAFSTNNNLYLSNNSNTTNSATANSYLLSNPNMASKIANNIASGTDFSQLTKTNTMVTAVNPRTATYQPPSLQQPTIPALVPRSFTTPSTTNGSNYSSMLQKKYPSQEAYQSSFRNNSLLINPPPPPVPKLPSNNDLSPSAVNSLTTAGMVGNRSSLSNANQFFKEKEYEHSLLNNPQRKRSRTSLTGSNLGKGRPGSAVPTAISNHSKHSDDDSLKSADEDDENGIRRSSRARKVSSSKRVFGEDTYSTTTGGSMKRKSIGTTESSSRSTGLSIPMIPRTNSKSQFLEDIIDLRQVHSGKKRIFIDFTTTRELKMKEQQQYNDPVHHLIETSNFMFGYFHGKLIPNEECTNYKFGNHGHCDSPSTIPNVGHALHSSPYPSASSYNKTTSRIGSSYQAEIPQLQSRKSIRKLSNAYDYRVWQPSLIPEDELYISVKTILNKKKEWIPTIGNIHYVYFPDLYVVKFKLCAILEVNPVLLKKPNKKLRERTVQIKVFDGEMVRKDN